MKCLRHRISPFIPSPNMSPSTLDAQATWDKLDLPCLWEFPANTDLYKHTSDLLTSNKLEENYTKYLTILLIGLASQIHDLQSLISQQNAQIEWNARIVEDMHFQFNQATPAFLPPPPSPPADSPPSKGAEKGKGKKKTYTNATKPTSKNSEKTSTVPKLSKGGKKDAEDLNKRQEKAEFLPSARCQFYATRITRQPLPDQLQCLTKLPALFGKIHKDGGLSYSHIDFTFTINDNGTIPATAHPSIPSLYYEPFFKKFTDAVNDTFKVKQNLFNPFRPAPSNVDIAIHNVPIYALPPAQVDLQTFMAESLEYAASVIVSNARFLKKPEDRKDKKTTTIVVAMSPEDAKKMGSTIRLLNRPQKCNLMYSANPATQCCKCFGLGNPTTACTTTDPTCSWCAGPHNKNQHRCSNTKCPKEGHIKPVENCCSAFSFECPNCPNVPKNEQHSATDPRCPRRVNATKITLKKSSQGSDQTMNTSD